MNLTAKNPHFPFPCPLLAVVTVFNPDVKSLSQKTTLTKVSTGQFEIISAGRKDQLGIPMIWTVRENGIPEFWPVPDHNYKVIARDVKGRDVTGGTKPVNVMPTLDMVNAINKKHAEENRNFDKGVVVEFVGNRRPPEGD